MKTVAVIAEYNPFHLGHAWQLSRARALADADYVIVLMSQDFVQRGEPALLNAAARTEMALAGGADLVLALPGAFACGSAGQFAAGAVGILQDLGCIDTLAFGQETPDLDLLQKAAAILAEEPDVFKDTLRSSLSSGMSYPQAQEKALLRSWCSEEASSSMGEKVDAAAIHRLCSLSNNILALEYTAALYKLKSPIRPLPICRTGAGYLDEELPSDHHFASASAIRRQLCTAEAAPDALSPYMGKQQLHILERELSRRPAPDSIYRQYDQLLQYCLMEHKDHLEDYLDITPDLARRIRTAAFSGIYPTVSALTEAVKTRQFTASRVRRALLHVFLSIPQNTAVLAGTPEAAYARILGFRTAAAPLLRRIKETASIPLISKNADAAALLHKDASCLFQQDMYAADMYAYLDGRDNFYGTGFRTSPIILRD